MTDVALSRLPALILAGGLGTRLRTLVNDRPKPMARFVPAPGGQARPFLEHQLEYLARCGIREFVFCVGYRHEAIAAHFGDGAAWGVNIQYSVEPELLGTGGALGLARPFVRGPFLVLNGDSFFDLDLNSFVQHHLCQREAAAAGSYVGTLALAQADDARSYGSVTLNEAGLVRRFDEKLDRPASAGSGPCLISAGLYVLEPEMFRFIPTGRKVSLEREVFPAVLAAGCALGGYRSEGFFVDIGTPDGYRRFERYLGRHFDDHQSQGSLTD